MVRLPFSSLEEMILLFLKGKGICSCLSMVWLHLALLYRQKEPAPFRPPLSIFSLGAAVDLVFQWCSLFSFLPQCFITIFFFTQLDSFSQNDAAAHLLRPIQQGRYILFFSITGWIAGEYQQTVTYVGSKIATWIPSKTWTDSSSNSNPKCPFSNTDWFLPWKNDSLTSKNNPSEMPLNTLSPEWCHYRPSFVRHCSFFP